MTRKILLFDLDAVLINSAGYYRSLTETVRRLSLALGFGDRSLEQVDIDAFEALDITAEWDSSALTAALLLLETWKTEPDARLPLRPPLPRHAASDRPWPDVAGFLAGLPRPPGRDPVGAARQAVLERLDGYSPAQYDLLSALLRDSRTPDRSLTFWLVQLFNLGSRRFTQTYGVEPGLDTDSMLETHDRPTLSKIEVSDLLRWRDGPDRGAAIVTNRPATSPGGIFNTPEAEIGVGVSGLVGVPVIAAGDLGFRAATLGLEPQAFLKPNPVHLLAGILVACGRPKEESLQTAIRLAHFGQADPIWQTTGPLHVSLFEDAAKGMRGLIAAAEHIGTAGGRIEIDLLGVAPGPPKSTTLEGLGARVFPNVSLALDAAVPGWRQVPR